MVAQLDLAEMRAAGGPAWLPPEGRLLFFYSLEHGAWGLDTGDAGSFLVRHETGPAGLADEPDDLVEDARFPAYSVSFAPAASFPSLERAGVDWRGISPEDEDALEAALQALEPPGPAHQLGGYPSAIQDDAMENDCERITRDLVRRTASRGETAPASAPADWRLLLQLDTDDDAGMMWGDTGRLYFWVREQDARAGDFSKCWLVLQCF
jgi:uncharacterized protein YwqG